VPARPIVEAKPAPPAEQPASSAEAPETLPRVLVVDDDERNLLAVSNVLEDIGEVVTARSGEEALRHLLKDEFAVILLDVYMPGMDGYETARIIRNRDQTKRIPIVFLSAVNKEAEHLLRGYEMGAVDYVFKPVDAVVLRSKIAVFVDLFAKTREIEQKAEQEQALLDANLRANSERLRVEQELRHAESRLFQAQKMDAIGKLTGGVAHDFNNLLAAVIGGLGLLERRANLDSAQLEILSMTRRAAEQGTELVRRLLAFARRQQLLPSNIDVSTLEKSVSGLLAHTLGGLVQVEWRVESKLWQAFADPGQLELALMNLVINARDAMPDGGKIIVGASNRMIERDQPDGLKPGHYVVLSVTDSGCGIPTEMIEEVLQPFVTTKDVGKGTGLGLSMVYGFARQSNGAFRLTSNVGVGTEAEIWLPRAAKGEKKSAAVALDGAVELGRSLRVLLVDDHPEVRSATLGMLEDLGHQVTAASLGSEALKLLSAKGGCDLLITDYAMPHLSGTELIGKARKLVPGLPSMIITGYADNDALAGRFGDVIVLPKPFTLESLSRAIRTSLSASIAEAGLAGAKR
jgi:signal transduction histidine kinase